MDDKITTVPRDAHVAVFGTGGFAGCGDRTRVEITLDQVSDEAYEKISRLIGEFQDIDPEQFIRGRDVPSYGIKVGDQHYSLYPRMLVPHMPNFPGCIHELYETIDAERARLGLEQQLSLRAIAEMRQRTRRLEP